MFYDDAHYSRKRAIFQDAYATCCSFTLSLKLRQALKRTDKRQENKWYRNIRFFNSNDSYIEGLQPNCNLEQVIMLSERVYISAKNIP